MGVYIKGMKMPKNCGDCWFEHAYEFCESKYEDCPLIELPPHGRCVDADEPISLVDTHKREVETTVAHIIERNCGIIKVIIPASEDGE